LVIVGAPKLFSMTTLDGVREGVDAVEHFLAGAGVEEDGLGGHGELLEEVVMEPFRGSTTKRRRR